MDYGHIDDYFMYIWLNVQEAIRRRKAHLKKPFSVQIIKFEYAVEKSSPYANMENLYQLIQI